MERGRRPGGFGILMVRNLVDELLTTRGKLTRFCLSSIFYEGSVA
jgi:hypothetical protein